jgi:FMN reductase
MPVRSRPLVVGVGGTLADKSSSELAMRYTLKLARALGAETEVLTGDALVMPMYAPQRKLDDSKVDRLLAALRASDAIVLASPGYHGSVSGLLKNALDYIEGMRVDSRSYLAGRAVGCIACAAGWQTTGSTLATLRAIVHSLRGWPTPLGVCINTSVKVFSENGDCLDGAVAGQLAILAEEVVEFARTRQLTPAE